MLEHSRTVDALHDDRRMAHAIRHADATLGR
jgi:hypothetical protein